MQVEDSAGRDGRRHPHTAALLGAQLLFNVGFYAVVPFLAIVLTDSFALGGTAVGLVLGVRTFTQQGLFLVGGTLADRFGARTIILLGCGVRTAGFLGLAGSLWTPSPQLWLFIIGTVLTGLGGALFSPGLNTLIAAAESRRGTAAGRATLFAWLGVTGELGAIVGPLAGSALLGWGFEVVAASGAVFFVGIGGFLWWVLPPAAAPEPCPGDSCRVRAWALRDRRFAGFAALHAVDLLAYNQLYLTLPLELRRVDGGSALVGAMFAWASVLTLALQLPLARWGARVGPRVALSVGYSAGASGFAVLAVSAAAGPGHSPALHAVAAAVTLLMIGQLLANPTALSLVPRLAGARPTGSYYGLLATCGGTMVLLGNLIAGALFGPDQQPSVWTWTFLAVLPAMSAVLVPRILRH
ncbi:MAG: MFS transporter [Micropruina sp.]|uniref:MFS transporter n=1 Tax=Micropruina sp. TaxID=2737536 RepID=UPI0039E6D54C